MQSFKPSSCLLCCSQLEDSILILCMYVQMTVSVILCLSHQATLLNFVLSSESVLGIQASGLFSYYYFNCFQSVLCFNPFPDQGILRSCLKVCCDHFGLLLYAIPTQVAIPTTCSFWCFDTITFSLVWSWLSYLELHLVL